MTRSTFDAHRRLAIKMLCGGMSAIACMPKTALALAPVATKPYATVGDENIRIEFDGYMRTRITGSGIQLTDFDTSETLTLADGQVADRFLASGYVERKLNDAAGSGNKLEVSGVSALGIEKTVELRLYDRFPGFAILRVRYRNNNGTPVEIKSWRNASHDIRKVDGGFWSFSGASHADRRDWIQPVKQGFDQRNYMGMNASDYGGGTPVADVWHRRAGLAVGHLEIRPKLISLPVTATVKGAALAIQADDVATIKSGASWVTHECFIATHEGDCFATLDTYRRFMALQGLEAPAPPQSAYEPIWCAWGYERHFNTRQILDTLPKAKSMGLEWAVLDDGWQTSEGDWKIDRSKFPRGEKDIAAFAKSVKAAGMRPRLWIAPLAVDLGTDLLHDHTDMLLLDKNGAAQDVTWWNALTLCPAYAPTIAYSKKLIKKIIGEWGYEGLKLDGQHLNGVAPCYNPAHNHKRPEESVEALQDFWKMVYDTAIGINPQAVVELCPCGTSFAFHNAPYTNQVPSSDPLSSWQIRTKGKTLKALMGASSAYAGDHVELSDGGRDFASSFGIGAVLSTKFTWPADTDKPIAPLPPGGYRLTAEKEALWRKWIALYREKMLPQGEYLGGLYDIGFDRPEAHVVRKDDKLHFAFYADKWQGPIELRGLGPGRYRLTNLFSGEPVGSAQGPSSRIDAAFEKFLLIEAVPDKASRA